MNDIEALNQMVNEMSNNSFIQDPFQPLRIDIARYNPEEIFKTFMTISNAIGYYLNLSLANKRKLIELGSRKAEGYNETNTERYEIEFKLESLKDKKNTIQQLFYLKGAEMKYIGKETGILP